MSRVHVKPLELGELVRRSDVIVVTAPGRAGRARRTLASRRRGPEGRPIPPFAYSTYAFVVAEVLAGSESIRRDGSPLGLRAGQRITVRDAEIRRDFELHVAYEAEGIMRSYVNESFPTDVDLETNDGPLLLLLTHDQKDDAFEFRCDGAWLPAGRRAAVVRLLRRSGR